MKNPKTAVGHLDADCFYVSAERVRYAPPAGSRSACWATRARASSPSRYEMKATGVKTGRCRSGRRRSNAPTAIYVKRDFRWYEVLSRMMLGVVRDVLAPRRVSTPSTSSSSTRPRRAGRCIQELRRGDPRPDPGAGRRAGDGRHRPDADAGQADLRHGQAVRRWRCWTSRRRPHLLADRPVTEITGIAGPAGRTAPALGHPDLPGPGPRRPPARPVAADGHGRGALVGAERRSRPADPRRPARRTRRSRAAAASARPPPSPIVLYRLAGPQPRAAGRGARVPRGPGRPPDGLGRLQGRPGGRRADVARGPHRPLRPAAGRRPPVPAAGVDSRAPATRMHLIAERLTPGPGPPGPVRRPPARRRGRRPAEAAGQRPPRPVRPPERRDVAAGRRLPRPGQRL